MHRGSIRCQEQVIGGVRGRTMNISKLHWIPYVGAIAASVGLFHAADAIQEDFHLSGVSCITALPLFVFFIFSGHPPWNPMFPVWLAQVLWHVVIIAGYGLLFMPTLLTPSLTNRRYAMLQLLLLAAATLLNFLLTRMVNTMMGV